MNRIKFKENSSLKKGVGEKIKYSKLLRDVCLTDPEMQFYQ